MPQSLVFHPLIALRTPALPFTMAVSRQEVTEKLSDPSFMEALWLGSPDLHEKASRLLAGDRPNAREEQQLYASLINYLNRMRSRCTPFGLFAACSLLPWSADSFITLGPTGHRHTRLDMQYVCSLAQTLSRSGPVQEKLLYFPNTSYYQAGDQIRYMECRYENGKRIYQHTSVFASEPLLTILKHCRSGLTPAAIYELIKTPDLRPEEVKAFIATLIDAQVLTSELEPGLTGEEFSSRLLQVLERINASGPDREIARTIRLLRQTTGQLQSLDSAKSTVPADYEKISGMLAAAGEPVDKKKLFQVDLFRPSLAGGLPEDIRQDLLGFIPLFKKLAAPPENSRLRDFRQKFRSRYEDRAKPLLEVLDPDMGIGYGSSGKSGYQPLVEDIVLPEAETAARGKTIRGSTAEQWLYRQVRAAEQEGRKMIALHREELAALPENQIPFPPSFSVIFQVPGPGQIQLEAVSGPSAINLVSRFAHADTGFQDLARSITAQEEANNPGVIFAEIIHLPEKRTGNILLRPLLRPYEIPYLAASGLPEARQVRLQDLYVSVKGDRIVLFSPELNQEIIPRLGTAHHYTADSLPVYLFLCDLQTQGIQAEMGLDWQPDRFDTAFLPRLTCQNIILGLATWQLNHPAYAPLLQAGPSTLFQAFQQFQKQWGLPDRFTFREGDRDLLIDAHYPDTITAWLNTIRQRDSIILREFIYDPTQSLVKDESGHPYLSQFIATAINQDPVYAPGAGGYCRPAPAGGQAFPVGSEWLYYKLYGGVQSGEALLTEVLGPLTDELLQLNLIDQWFFLRYQDPEDHIRLRLHLPAPEKIGPVIQLVYQYLRPYQNAGLIWKIQTCTYQRETERYGPGAIELAEQLFFGDSLAVVQYLSQLPEEGEDRRWIWGLTAIDQLLTSFQYPLPAKLKLMADLKAMFAREFRQDKNLKWQLDQKYRHYRAGIQQQFECLGGENAAAPYRLKSGAIIQSVAGQLLKLAGKGQLEVSLDDLLISFIHLHVNRLIPARQRLHELLLYDFLYRHYKTEQVLLAPKPVTSYPR